MTNKQDSSGNLSNLQGFIDEVYFMPRAKYSTNLPHKNFTSEHLSNLRVHLVLIEPRSISCYIEEIRYEPKTNSYYLAMREESRKGIMEFHLELDWAATHAPSIAEEILAPFHRNDFSEQLYLDLDI